jgi:hypothetical protein
VQFMVPGEPRGPRWGSGNQDQRRWRWHLARPTLAFGSESISIQGFPQFQTLNDLIAACALAGEPHEPGAPNDPALQDLCGSLAALMGSSTLGGAEIAWLLSYDLQSFRIVASWLADAPSALADETALAYIRFLQNGGEMAFKNFAGLYKTVSELAAVLGLDWDRVLFLLENGELAKEMADFLEEYEGSEESIISASFVFETMFQGEFDGPYGASFDQIVAHYDAIASNPIIIGMLVAMEAAVLRVQYPDASDFWISATALKNVLLEEMHLALDLAGFIPGIGEFADLANGVIYTIEGDWFNATLSFAAAVPIAGWSATGAKWANKAIIGASGRTITLKYVIIDQSTNLIKFGDRKQLRTVLRTPSGQQAHHIVPWGKTDHPVIQRAASAGSDKAFHPNEVFNGISLPESRHLGPHNDYDAWIDVRLNQWYNDNILNALEPATPAQAADSIRQWLQTLKAQIQSSQAHINTIVPPAIPNP